MFVLTLTYHNAPTPTYRMTVFTLTYHDCLGPTFTHQATLTMIIPTNSNVVIVKKQKKKKAGLLFWEWCRLFHSDTQVGRLKAPKPVYCQDWTGYSPDDQLKHDISN